MNSSGKIQMSSHSNMRSGFLLAELIPVHRPGQFLSRHVSRSRWTIALGMSTTLGNIWTIKRIVENLQRTDLWLSKRLGPLCLQCEKNRDPGKTFGRDGDCLGGRLHSSRPACTGYSRFCFRCSSRRYIIHS